MSKRLQGKNAARRRKPDEPTSDNTDERIRRSKTVILRTAAELMIEKGMGGLSVDEVSKRSGVAKTTIYRHWRTRSDLVLAACASISTAQETPDSGTFEGDLTSLLLDLAHLLETARWPLVLPSIIDAAERDPQLAALYGREQQRHATPYLVVIERGKKAGAISPKADAAAMVAQLVGPLFYRRWFSREPLDKDFVKSVLRSAIARARTA
jgi:AcrR family transcriptional regulator